MRAGIKSQLRFPLQAASELIGSLLLFDMPEPERIDELSLALKPLLPLIAMSLKNALSHVRIEKQAQELEQQAHDLERRVAERTAELEDTNKDLNASRLAALNMMEDAIEARQRAEETSTALQLEIAERKRVEEALRESEMRLNLAVASSPIPIMIHDEDGQVLQLSIGWTNFSGYTLEDIPTLPDWTERAYGERTGTKKEYIDNLFCH